MDPDMEAFKGWVTTWPQMAAQSAQNCMAPAVIWPLKTNMTLGCNRDSDLCYP